MTRLRTAALTAVACLAVGAPLAVAADLPGTPGPDVLLGTRGPDTASGNAGNDLINGFRGDDVLRGDAGADVIFGGRGFDVLLGGTEDDVLFAGPGRDAALGQAGNDVVVGGQGPDVASGGTGDDRVIGDGGNDTLYAGIGQDVLIGGRGADVLLSRAADGQIDYLICGPGYDVVFYRPNEDKVHRSCERAIPVTGAEADPADEDAPPAAEARAGGNDSGADADSDWLDEGQLAQRFVWNGPGRR